MACELLFPCSRDQDVAVGFQNVSFVGFGSWESHDGAVLLQKVEGTRTEKYYVGGEIMLLRNEKLFYKLR